MLLCSPVIFMTIENFGGSQQNLQMFRLLFHGAFFSVLSSSLFHPFTPCLGEGASLFMPLDKIFTINTITVDDTSVCLEWGHIFVMLNFLVDYL